MIEHGWCLLWNPSLITIHVVSDLAIALSYYMIPLALWIASAWLTESVGKLVVVLFGAFIIACGTTHVMDIIVLMYPAYWIQGIIKIITAALSVSTALLVLRLLVQQIHVDQSLKKEQ